MKRRDGEEIGYTKDDALKAIQDFIIEEGRLPTTRDADKGLHGLPSVKVFKRLYGSFSAAMKEYNLPSDRRGGHNRKKETPNGAPAPKKRRRVRSTKSED